jgi:hypothetical protein
MVPKTHFYSIEAFGGCGLRLLLLPTPMGWSQKLMSLFQSILYFWIDLYPSTASSAGPTSAWIQRSLVLQP